MTFFRSEPPNGDEGLGPPPGPFRFARRQGFRLPGGLMRWAVVLVALIVLYIVANILKGIYADWLWFDSVDYLSVYQTRIVTRVWLFAAGGGVFLALFGANVLLALLGSSAGPAPELDGAAQGPPRRVLLVVLVAASIFLAIIFGAQAAGQWDTILLFINSESFGGEGDPEFGKDIGFYIFRLPALNFIAGWSLAATVLTTLAVGGVYATRLLVGGFAAEAPRLARTHVSLLLVAVLGLFVWRYWLQHYGLVYSDRGAVFGAAYTDLHAVLPVIYVLMALGSLTAVCLLVNAVRRGLLWLPVAAASVWVLAAIVGGLIYPATVQRFQVEPNELARERTYIQRNIDATRAAYGLDQIEEQPFPARAEVTVQELDDNPETLQNIRLWDHRPLIQTLNQIQTIRPLYTFLNVDVDRYVIDGEQRQVMLAARELDPELLPADARSWVRRRLQFTHGYGAAVVPVNEVVQEGLPDFFLKDIPPSGVDELAVTRPQIYFGELPDDYVVVGSGEEEFDYPVGEEQTATSRFDAEGGVRIDSFLRRLVYSWELADTNILISDALSGDSRVLYRRNIRDRVEAIAPFLQLDFDPYLVVADGQLYWIQDAYTSSDRYPYSTRSSGLNYVRNSVKVTINAYDGTVKLYLVDPDDPIARAYDRIYPDLFTPFEELPEALRAHVRYPEDLFRIQTQLYRTYHIRNSDDFYRREDAWDLPTEIFIDQEQPIEPYYVIMRLPGDTREEFVQFVPFTPAGKRNTIAWLAARSDAENYGTLLAFRFPTATTVFGPSQVESRIDQDTTISAQISLWNQSGSQVLRGNLLMIPIGEGNLFVEPIYLQATGRQLPELKRVVVVNGNTIAMEPTLGQALAVILGRAPPTGPVVEGPDGEPDGGPATPTPVADETPAPTATAPPTAELPDDTAALIAEANEAFERAQELLRAGDFAGYGLEIERLREILSRLSGGTQPQ